MIRIRNSLSCLVLSCCLHAVWASGEAAPGSVDTSENLFWSFLPLSAPEPPPVRDTAWPRNPIDQFILEALEASGITPAPAADRRTLMRRAHFGVIGLPPQEREAERFLDDDAPDAYERLVDALLDSPHYGERWGRHWLDVARYADSDGYEFDMERPTAFHYRDFVIAALNEDMPYDQFVRWQLAGDEYAPDNPLAIAATGFLTAGPTIDNQETEQNRYDELDDMLSTTGSAFLGLTVGCARCHDHKFDPISMRDYYGMLSAFVTTKRQQTPLTDRRAAAQWRAAVAGWEEAVKAEKDRLEAWKQAARDHLGAPGEVKDDALRAALPAEKLAEWDALQQKLAEIEQQQPQAPPMALAMTDASAEPAPNFMLRRGDPALKDAPVPLAFLSAIPGDATGFQPALYRRDQPSTYQRTALAEWLVDTRRGAGRLAARVIVNRLWHHHFGRGIVRTPSDFGTQGDPPSHPELLDWLAGELIRQEWRLKPIHRMILTSATYRQGTEHDAVKAEIDPGNRLWWRREPLRLEAEVLRDAVLAVSECLNPGMFGPGVFPYMHPDAIATGSTGKWPANAVDNPESWRRSVYIFVRRSARLPMLDTFDTPDTVLSCSRRMVTTVPSQALALMNSRFMAEQAQYLANRVRRETGSLESAIERAYLLALSRPPRASELEKCLAFLETQTARHGAAGPAAARQEAFVDLCQIVLNLNEFLYVE